MRENAGFGIFGVRVHVLTNAATIKGSVKPRLHVRGVVVPPHSLGADSTIHEATVFIRVL